MTAKFGGTKTSLIILMDAVSRIWIEYRRASLALPQDVWALSKAGGWNHLKARSLSCLVGMLAAGLRPQFFSTCNLPTRAWLGFLTAWWLGSRGKCLTKESESSPAMPPFFDPASEIIRHHFHCIIFIKAVTKSPRFKGPRNRHCLFTGAWRDSGRACRT